MSLPSKSVAPHASPIKSDTVGNSQAI
jgi:hypothetical protein